MSSTATKRSSTKKRSDKKSKKKNFDRKIAGECGELLGERVTDMQYPGGRSRRSFRLILRSGRSVIVSIRPKRYRAKKERTVLKELSARGASVPKLLASNGAKMLIQEEIAGKRLSEAMHNKSESRVEKALDAALTSLALAQEAGTDAGLDTRFETLGESFDWLVGLLDRPAVIGNILEVPAPRPNLKRLETLLAVRKPRFIKWDARPGNAMVHKTGEVYWFDWEHCGSRNRLDDMAWLLADEYVPDFPGMEERLIEKHIASFADDLSVDEAKLYLSAYGVFHMSVRLGLICKYKVRGDWWSHRYCLERDKVGVSWKCMRRVCDRGTRWAISNPHTEPLATWFAAIADRFEDESRE